MKFFLPGAQTPEETTLIYDFLRSSAQYIALRITERKIYGILYKRMGKFHRLKVDYPDPIHGEIVIAIIEASLYILVFTPNRGVAQGEPHLIRIQEVLSVEEFEG